MKRTLLSLACFLLLASTYAQSEKDSVYMFCYFKGNGLDGLHYAFSKDGLKYEALNNDSTFLRPVVAKDKLMRDPCIIRGADGLFRLVWTVSWNDKGIGIASSKDLTHWSEQQFLPVMENEVSDSVMNAWAPEITYDPYTKEYMLYWSSTVKGKFLETKHPEDKYNHRLYYKTTKDFKTYSDTKLLYDGGFDIIDATIKVLGKKNYLMFLKDETLVPVLQKNLRTAKSEHLTEGYSKPSEPITGKYWAEGPTALNMNGKWIVYFDKYREHKYGAVTSTDLKTWTDISSEIELPKGLRHGTVFTISTEEFNKWFK